MNFSRHNAPGARGFTLMELLLAILVFSIVLAAIQTVFYSALQLRNATTQAIEASLPLERTLAVIKHDLSNLVMPGTNGLFAGQLQSTPTNGTGGITSSGTAAGGGFGTIGGGITFGGLSSQSGSQLGDQTGPQFFTASGTLSDVLPWGDIQRVSYYLVNPIGNTVGKDLVRAVTRNLLPIADEEITEQFLMSGVEDFTLDYYDLTLLEWVDVWDSSIATTNALPGAIRVTIQLADQNGARSRLAPVQLIVPISLQSATNQASSSALSP